MAAFSTQDYLLPTPFYISLPRVMTHERRWAFLPSEHATRSLLAKAILFALGIRRPRSSDDSLSLRMFKSLFESIQRPSLISCPSSFPGIFQSSSHAFLAQGTLHFVGASLLSVCIMCRPRRSSINAPLFISPHRRGFSGGTAS